MSCRADPMTVNGQLSRPRPGSYLAVSGQSAVAAVKPWKNPFIESFNSRLRDECLNINLFWSMTHAQVATGLLSTSRGPRDKRQPRLRPSA